MRPNNSKHLRQIQSAGDVFFKFFFEKNFPLLSETTLYAILLFVAPLIYHIPLYKEELQSAYEVLEENNKTIYAMEATRFSACRVAFVDRL